MPFYKKAFIVLQLILWFAIIWPGYAWYGSSATPLVLGIPFSFFWIVAWVLIGFAGIYGLYHFDYSAKAKQDISVDPDGLFSHHQENQEG
jgi:hypothetical protein